MGVDISSRPWGVEIGRWGWKRDLGGGVGEAGTQCGWEMWQATCAWGGSLARGASWVPPRGP